MKQLPEQTASKATASQPTPTMSEARFRSLVEAYGANRARWPLDERAAADTFVAGSPTAATWLAEQARLDALLDGSMEHEVSATLQRRVAEIPVRDERSATEHVTTARAELATARGELANWWPFLRLRNLLVAGLAAGALGVVAGMAQSDGVVPSDAQTSWDELSDLALARDLSEELSP